MEATVQTQEQVSTGLKPSWNPISLVQARAFGFSFEARIKLPGKLTEKIEPHTLCRIPFTVPLV